MTENLAVWAEYDRKIQCKSVYDTMCDFVYDTKMYDKKCTTFKIMNCDHVSFHLILYLDLNKQDPFQNKAQTFSVAYKKSHMSTLGSVKSGYTNVSMFAWPTSCKLTGQSPEWIQLRNESRQSLSEGAASLCPAFAKTCHMSGSLIFQLLSI